MQHRFLSARTTFIALTLLGYIYFGLSAFVAQSMVDQPFPGFLVSESQRVSELQVPGWSAVEGLRLFDSRDLLLTYGAMALAGLIILLLLLPALYIAPQRWLFPLWAYGFLGAIWLFGSFDYYSTYALSPITIIAGGLLPFCALFFTRRILFAKSPAWLKRTLWVSMGSCQAVTLLHLLVYRQAIAFETVSYLLLWINGAFWSGAILFLCALQAGNSRLSFRESTRAKVLLLTHGIFYGIPILLIPLAHYFHVTFSVNQFVPLLSLFPLCVLFICFHENYSQRIEDAERRLMEQERFSSIGVLSAGLAHEINNPLHLLSMNVHILEKEFQKYKAEIPKGLYKTLDVKRNAILICVERIVRIIDSVRAFTKRSAAMEAHVDLTPIIEDCIAQVLPQDSERNIRIETDFDNINDTRVSPTGMSQILTNLIGNSMDAVAADGHIEIHAFCKDETLHLAVKDNGRGIPEDILAKVFDPFFTTKDPGKGMGLGLWITAQLVAAQGGRIHTLSNPGKGTRIEMEFPQNGRAHQVNSPYSTASAASFRPAKESV